MRAFPFSPRGATVSELARITPFKPLQALPAELKNGIESFLEPDSSASLGKAGCSVFRAVSGRNLNVDPQAPSWNGRGVVDLVRSGQTRAVARLAVACRDAWLRTFGEKATNGMMHAWFADGDPTTRDSALVAAVHSERPRTVSMVLRIAPTLRDDSTLVRAAYFASIQKRSHAIIDELMRSGLPVDVRGMGGGPIHAAARLGDLHIMAKLVSAGACVNAVDTSRTHNTPLHEAVLAKNPRVTKWLLMRGADFERANSKGRTPLQMAVMEKRRSLVATLLLHGSDPLRETKTWQDEPVPSAKEIADDAGDAEIISVIETALLMRQSDSNAATHRARLEELAAAD